MPDLRSRGAAVLVTAAATLVGLIGPVRPAAARVVSGGAQTIAAGLTGVDLGGLAIARDGSGGLVYGATSGGTGHVYLSRLSRGDFLPPVQLDPGGGASSPVVSADNTGDLLIAYLVGTNLYATESIAGGPLTAPQLIATGAANPSIAMNLFGVGYLAFSAAAPGGGDNVDVWFWNGSSWAPANPTVMNSTPGDDAGTGSGAPSVAAATDGVGIVAWGEGGHVESRRLAGTQTSVEIEQDDVPTYEGLTETGATAPQVAVGGDSSYPDIVYTERFQNGSGTRTRAMLTRLIAEQTHPIGAVDGATGTQQGLEPGVAMGEAGRGMIAAANAGPGTAAAPSGTAPYGVSAVVLAQRGVNSGPQGVAGGGAVDPHPVPAAFGQTSSGLAWIDGSTGVGQVVLAYAADGVSLAAPITLSNPSLGPVQGADGLLLAGDDRGDAAAAWLQGNGDLEVDELYTPPGTPGLTPSQVFANTSSPVLDWNGAAENWGPLAYTVAVSNGTAQNVNATSAQLSGLTDGRYAYSVQSINRVGETGGTATGSLTVDTYAPHLRLRLTGAPRVGAPRRLGLLDGDVPNPAEPGAVASGIRRVTIDWGDGGATRSGGPGLAGADHVYREPGVYTVTATVEDAVANTTTLTLPVRVLP